MLLNQRDGAMTKVSFIQLAIELLAPLGKTSKDLKAIKNVLVVNYHTVTDNVSPFTEKKK